MARDYTEIIAEMYRGDHQDIALAVFQANGTTAQNITGWSLWMTGKLNVDDADAAALFTRTVANGGIVVTSATGGLATITLLPANTSALTDASTDVLIDVQGKSGTGRVSTLKSGKLVVKADLTRAIV